ncbi:MAG: PRC-barrel domain-containing protein [Isosphaeraceae bacterium]
MLDTKRTVELACCIALALGAVAHAAQQRIARAAGERGDLDQIRKVSTLIGTHVVNREKADNQIADLRDLVISPDGMVRYAVLGVGGIAGVGQTYTAAPFDLLSVRLDDDKWSVVLGMTIEQLKKSPAIQSENYRELTDPQWIARVDEFFRTHGESPHEPRRETRPAQREHRAFERVILATKIRAANLKNGQNEELGKVEDLLLDQQHRVVFVILTRGGVAGIGEQYVPVPWSNLNLDSNQENLAVTFLLDARKAELEKAPLIKGDNYATLLGPGFAEQVRRYFKMIGRGAEREQR